MYSCRDLDVQEALPGDAALKGVHWSADGSELLILLRVSPTAISTLRCRHATNVSVHLDYGDYVGTLPAWEHSVSQVAGGFRVVLDFQPIGAITLECAEVTLTTDDAPAQTAGG